MKKCLHHRRPRKLRKVEQGIKPERKIVKRHRDAISRQQSASLDSFLMASGAPEPWFDRHQAGPIVRPDQGTGPAPPRRITGRNQ